MDGLGVDEVGRSINGTGSRNTGATVCLIRLGAATPVGKASPQRKARPNKNLPLLQQVAREENPKTPSASRSHGTLSDNDDAASTPAGKPRKRKLGKQPATPQPARCMASASRSVCATSNKGEAPPPGGKQTGKREAEAEPAAQPRKKTHPLKRTAKHAAKSRVEATSKARGCHYGQDLKVLRAVLEVARRSKISQTNPTTRASQYMSFLDALPHSLVLGDYTKKHICRKHMIQYFMSRPEGLKNLKLHELLEITPDVGNHLGTVPSSPATKLALTLYCETMQLSMWPCLVNEGLKRAPHAAEIVWGLSKQVLARVLRECREQHGFSPSPRVLFTELERTPEAQAILAKWQA